MPRISRAVFEGIPHHVTQRGNRRQNVFFTNEDRQIYKRWLREYCDRYGVEILAYCLMTNHVHLVAIPRTEDALHRALRPLHMRYAQRINRQNEWSGHLWQGRFFSSPLDEAYLWAAIRYVERNPVRARLVSEAERYPWSSAPAHCRLREDPLLRRRPRFWRQIVGPQGWSEWLKGGEAQETVDILRRNVEKGLPCGDETFVERLEALAGRSLHFRSQGRPMK
jgi:putative transposase